MMGLSRSERIARTADKWVARSAGSLSAEESAERDRWRAADPRHEQAWQESQAIWVATAGMVRPRTAPARSIQRSLSLPALALASFVAIALVAGGALLVQRQRATPRIASVADWSAGGSVRPLQLGDGTRVELDPGSQLHTDFSGPIRAIHLIRGTGRFEVAHDASHPFVVTAGDRKIIAIGTRFEVALRPHGLIVTLYQGAVEVTSGARASLAPIRMRHGQRLTVDEGHQSLAPIPAGPGIAASGDRDVEPTPVGDIVEEANRTAALPIRFADPMLAARKVEGRFDTRDSERLAAELGAALDLHVKKSGGALWLSGATTS